ncbi:MAG: CRISPR-associated endonuclease Cas2 [Promethearchaeia archaeon]
MRYIIIYDIPIEFDNIRTQISDMLLSYNLVRLQYSVFFGRLSKSLVEEVELRLKKRMKDVPGDVRIIPVCNKCHSKAITIKSKFEDGYKTIEDILAL